MADKPPPEKQGRTPAQQAERKKQDAVVKRQAKSAVAKALGRRK
jgi:hypothetical protein